MDTRSWTGATATLPTQKAAPKGHVSHLKSPQDSSPPACGRCDWQGMHHPNITRLLQIKHTAVRTFVFMDYVNRGALKHNMMSMFTCWRERFPSDSSMKYYRCHRCTWDRDLELECLLLADAPSLSDIG